MDSEQGHGPYRVAGMHGPDRGIERRQLGIAADERRLAALYAAAGQAQGLRRLATHQPARDRRLDALDLQGLLRLGIEQAAHQ